SPGGPRAPADDRRGGVARDPSDCDVRGGGEICVSSIVATLSSLDVKAMGVMLASAVLMDATIVRTVLLPTSMKPLGDRTSCWYLPSRLEGLPQVPAPAVHPEPELDPSRLSVDVAREDALVSLALGGDLDVETAPQFRERLADVRGGHHDAPRRPSQCDLPGS